MLRIRLTRTGRKGLARWRIAAFDSRTRRDGRPVEYLGSYNPEAKDDEDKVALKKDRVQYWLGHGAQPTRTVASLLKKAGMGV